MSALSRIAYEWAARCFGTEHVTNLPIRSLRTVEEAIELCQALNVPKGAVLAAVDLVYSRPPGDPKQEIGGILLTTNIICESINTEPAALFERELRRVLRKPPAEMAKRNQDKINLGLDAGSPVTGLPRTPALDALTGTARIIADRMWRQPAIRKQFEDAASLTCSEWGTEEYQRRFREWCAPQIAANGHAAAYPE